MVVVVQCLSVDRSDRGERKAIVVGISHSRYSGRYVRLAQARTNGTDGGQVHLGGHVAGLLDLDDLLLTLVDALVYYAHDERNRGLLRAWSDAQPLL